MKTRSLDKVMNKNEELVTETNNVEKDLLYEV